jgi:hypothetical protein
VLARQYRRLLVAYPRAYRDERGDEIIATLLDLAGPRQRRPTIADAIDLLGSGVRRRLGTASVAGFEAGLRLAAPFALAIAAGVSAYAWWRVEPMAPGAVGGLLGRFRTLGPMVYAGWLLAAMARSVLRPRPGRVVIGIALALTVVVPLFAPLTTVDRPPLWVLFALGLFGLLALAGTPVGAPSTDERLAVPAGAVAVAVTASAVVLAWPPAGGGFDYYYQPTIARVGAVVGATVAAVAAIAVARVVRRRPAQEWLWATVLLGLPAGWLGPFDSARLRYAAEADIPRFGRLAQIILATCLAAVAMVTLVRRHRPGGNPPPALARFGAATLAALAGVAAFAGLGRLGVVGFTGPTLRSGLPWHVVGTGVVVLVVGAVALTVPPAPSARSALVWAPVGLAAAWCVAAYDNDWRWTGWPAYGHTMALVATLSYIPLTAVVAAAVATVRRYPVRAGVVVVVGAGWLAYVTLPYVFSWGPVLVLLLLLLGLAPIMNWQSARRG